MITAAIELTRHMHACMHVSWCIDIAESIELAKAHRHASAIPPALHKWINFHRFDKVKLYLARCMAPMHHWCSCIKSCDQVVFISLYIRAGSVSRLYVYVYTDMHSYIAISSPFANCI